MRFGDGSNCNGLYRSRLFGLAASELEIETKKRLHLPVVLAVEFGVEAVVVVVGCYFKVEAYGAAEFCFQLHTYAEVVHETIVLPSEGEVLSGRIAQGMEVIVVPSIAQSETADEVGVEHVVLLGGKGVAEVEHQVDVGSHELVVVGLVQTLETALLVDTAHVEASTDNGREHTADTNGSDGGNQFAGFVVGECGLGTTLNTHKGIGIVLLLGATILRKSSVRRCSHEEGRR